MHLAIQSGVFCTIFALGTLITFRKSSLSLILLLDISLIGVTPQSNLFCLFAFPAGRIYTNVSDFLFTPQNSALSDQTLMDTLNVRHGLRDILNETRAVCLFTCAHAY